MSISSLDQAPCVYQGVRFNVHSVKLPGRDDRAIQRDAVLTPEAVVILPLIDDQTVVMIRNERFVVGDVLWELPAGTLERGEEPRRCAARELAEETGYQARELTRMINFYPSPGICSEQMYAFVGRGLEHVGQDLDENERITVEVVSLKQTMRMIKDNTVRDAKTIATLLYYTSFIAGNT